MADVNYIVPGVGTVQDTEIETEIIIPGFGTYQERVTPVVGGQLLMHPGNDGLGSYQFDNEMNGGINA